jgi:hypothetical protein
MKKIILALALASLAALGGCASTQGFGTRFERNLQLDVSSGSPGTTGRHDVDAHVSLHKQAQAQAQAQSINLTNPGPRDLALFGQEASQGERPWPNYDTADGWALFLRLNGVLDGLLSAKAGTPVPGLGGATITHCLTRQLGAAQCFYAGGGSVSGPILYKGGHIAFEVRQGNQVLGIMLLY